MLWMITEFSLSPSFEEAFKHLDRVFSLGVRRVSFRDKKGILTDKEKLELASRLYGKYPGTEVFFHSRPDLSEFFDKKVHLSSRDAFLLEPLKEEGYTVAISAHSHREVEDLLSRGADCVFLSPIYLPLSKPDDTRHTVSPMLNEKVWLLGGMNTERVRNLIKKGYRNIAGISLFYDKRFVESLPELVEMLESS